MIAHMVFAAATLLLFSFPQISFAQVTVEDRFAIGQSKVVSAHRSAMMGGAPENTLAWIEQGIAIGVDMLHINPQVTSDGHYVLMHDQTLNRMTNVEEVFPKGPPGGPSREQRGGKDYVRDYKLAEIRHLSINASEGGERHPVATLGEALELIGGRTLVLLGLKAYDVEGLAAALGDYDTENALLFDLYFSGTDQSKLRELSEATGIAVSVALFRSKDHLADLEHIYGQIGPALKLVGVDRDGVTPEFLARVSEMGLRISVSGWDTGEDFALAEEANPGPWAEAINLGFVLSTDRPDLVLDLLND